jgi:hypothetical protein
MPAGNFAGAVEEGSFHMISEKRDARSEAFVRRGRFAGLVRSGGIEKA